MKRVDDPMSLLMERWRLAKTREKALCTAVETRSLRSYCRGTAAHEWHRHQVAGGCVKPTVTAALCGRYPEYDDGYRVLECLACGGLYLDSYAGTGPLLLLTEAQADALV